MNTPLFLRAAQYVRMSTEHQHYSPENQLDVIRQYAAMHTMEIVREYSDHGGSGLNIAGQESLNSLTGKRREATGVIFPGGTKAVQKSWILCKWLDYKGIFWLLR